MTDYTLELNSIGDANCRPAYVERLSRVARRARRRPRRRGAREARDVAASRLRREERARAGGARRRAEDRRLALRRRAASTSRACASTSTRSACAYELVPTLVRGLDYYTRTTFEFKDEAIGAQDTICGGGRYDGLVEAIGGPPTPGIGFGAGIERLLLSVGERELPRDGDRRVLRRRRGRRPIAGARDDGAPARARARRRHRLRRPLEEGTAHAGGAARREDDRRRRRRRRPHRASRRRRTDDPRRARG